MLVNKFFALIKNAMLKWMKHHNCILVFHNNYKINGSNNSYGGKQSIILISKFVPIKIAKKELWIWKKIPQNAGSVKGNTVKNVWWRLIKGLVMLIFRIILGSGKDVQNVKYLFKRTKDVIIWLVIVAMNSVLSVWRTGKVVTTSVLKD